MLFMQDNKAQTGVLRIVAVITGVVVTVFRVVVMMTKNVITVVDWDILLLIVHLVVVRLDLVNKIKDNPTREKAKRAGIKGSLVAFISIP